MVAIKAQQAAAFTKSPPATLSAVLFFGSDPGLVTERSQQIAAIIAARENPPGEVQRLDDSDLDEDPGRLQIELQTRPMFSGRKIIRVTASRRINAALLKDILQGGPLEGFLVVEAGNLKPDDALRSQFEGQADLAAVACYADSAADIELLIRDVLTSHKLTISNDARALLQSRLGADRALSRAEIEKLALYAAGNGQITEDDVEAIVGDAADLALEKIAEAAASGRAIAAVSDYGRAIASGESAQAIILIMQRYFLKLHRIRADLDSGRSLEDALRSLRPPLHFKQKDLVAAQARSWTASTLDAALVRIADTAKSARLSSQLEDTLAERLVLALAAMAAPQHGSHAARRR